MTLILTDIYPQGIVMAGDSSVTFRRQGQRLVEAIPNLARKIVPVHQNHAACAIWGRGDICGTPADVWLASEVNGSRQFETIGAMAEHLARELDEKLGPSIDGSARIGVHVAGYERMGGALLPTFYHVHDGKSEMLADQMYKDPSRITAAHDLPPDKILSDFASGTRWTMRNGNYNRYAQVFGHLQELFIALREKEGFVVPNDLSLDGLGAWAVFQIRTMAELYRLSNDDATIGGRIDYVTISPQGIHSEGSRFT